MGKAANTKIEEVARLSKQGLGVREIANAMGVKPHAVHCMRDAAKKQGHDFPSLKDGLSDDERAEIVRLYGGGATHKQIAVSLGRAQSTVRRALFNAGLLEREYGLPKVKQGYVGRALSVADEPAQRWILEQVPEGSTLAETLVEIALDQYFEKGANA